jgi:hypothetical protein
MCCWWIFRKTIKTRSTFYSFAKSVAKLHPNIEEVCKVATEKHKVQLQRWKSLIQDRMNSNLKILEWCKQNNVSKDAYYYWLKQVRIEAVAEANSKFNRPVISESNSFVEIKPVAPSVMASVPIKSTPSAIIRGNCLEIELFDDASPTFIRKLMEAVRYA